MATIQEIQEEKTPSEPDSKSPDHLDHGEVNAPYDPAQRLWRFMVRQKRQLLLTAVLAFAAFVAVAEMVTPVARHFNNKGVELQAKGELYAAIDEYRRALLLRSSYAEARYNPADAYEEIPDYDKAEEEYQKAIDSDVTLYAAYNNLARLYILRRRDSGAALRLIDRGFSSNPQEKSVQYSLLKNSGWANFELRNYVRAEQDLRHAVVRQNSATAESYPCNMLHGLLVCYSFQMRS